ncbi:hypothetical protein N7495_006494 [Penicillium taxi]|uniref:uncharacterized protein n=1 Tax=Penicillium taxi TaxID=168475 RepID=UPI002544E4EC|nr:uncharacterized protein N7495_006494 [Penicillium taxi]KAJ5894803.1 hypothetical protein N7495_006494 [Penicillium taxi]
MPGEDALSLDHVLSVAANALHNEQPSLKTSYEAVALIGHACMTAVDFRLVGLGEDHTLESATEIPTLPAEWNANDTFAFRYAHTQSSMEYLLKVSRLGNNAVVFALALGDDRTSSFDLPVKDYISPSALPVSAPESIASALQDVFISRARLSDLIGLLKINVIQKLAPGLYKEGYEDPSQNYREQPEYRRTQDPLHDDGLPQPARPHPYDDPLEVAPRRPTVDFPAPGFENEFEINRPPRAYPPGFQGGFNIGERDLYPAGMGPRDPLRGTMGPGSSGGMHPTFDDPLFAGHGGSGGYDPRAPPGARYDPVMPGEPPVGRNRGHFGPGAGRGLDGLGDRFGGGPGGFNGGGGFGGGFGGDII